MVTASTLALTSGTAVVGENNVVVGGGVAAAVAVIVVVAVVGVATVDVPSCWT